MFKTNPLLLACAVLGAGLSIGCDDSPGNTMMDAGMQQTDNGMAPTDMGPPPPVYAVIAQDIAQSGSTSYVVLTSELDPAEPLSRANALEIQGRAIGNGTPGYPYLYVGSGDAATITRYELAADGTSLTAGPTVSFASEGVTGIGEYQGQIQIVSMSKAYYFDSTTGQVIIFDPTAMTLTGSITVTGLPMANTRVGVGPHPIWNGTDLIYPVGWRQSTPPFAPVGGAGVVVIDTTMDTAQLITDSRCAYAINGVMASDGDIYVATEAYGAAVHRIDEMAAPEPCLLRFDPDTDSFDAMFSHDLSTLNGGGAVGSILAGPDGDSAYVRVLDETQVTIDAMTNARVLASAPAWRYAELELSGAFGITPVAGSPATSGSVLYLETGDLRLVPESDSMAVTSLRDLSGGNIGGVVDSIDGYVFSAFKLR